MIESKFIPVAAPALVGNELKYVTDCLTTQWISSNGKYIGQFEESFASFCRTAQAIACCNGTVALHLALLALGVKEGDEVLVPTLTYVATANCVTYCGARPVFLESEPATWNLDPELIEAKITPRTKGIIVVHLYGQPVDMDAVISIAQRHGLFVIEDAAEAHGAEYKGQRVGSIGNIGIFSFFGNKIVTTGEGGMVVTNDANLAQKMRQLKAQGLDPSKRYWFPVIGYNYRMTNICAAIGLAQMEKIDWHMERRHEIASWYQRHLKDIQGISWQQETASTKHAYWMFTILLEAKAASQRDALMGQLLNAGIETRPVFYPVHSLPPYAQSGAAEEHYSVAERIAAGGINLPTWAGLKREDVSYICEKLANYFDTKSTSSCYR